MGLPSRFVLFAPLPSLLNRLWIRSSKKHPALPLRFLGLGHPIRLFLFFLLSSSSHLSNRHGRNPFVPVPKGAFCLLQHCLPLDGPFLFLRRKRPFASIFLDRLPKVRDRPGLGGSFSLSLPSSRHFLFRSFFRRLVPTRPHRFRAFRHCRVLVFCFFCGSNWKGQVAFLRSLWPSIFRGFDYLPDSLFAFRPRGLFGFPLLVLPSHLPAGFA